MVLYYLLVLMKLIDPREQRQIIPSGDLEDEQETRDIAVLHPRQNFLLLQEYRDIPAFSTALFRENFLHDASVILVHD